MKNNKTKSSVFDEENMEVMPTTRIPRNELRSSNKYSSSKLDRIANNLNNTNKNLIDISSSSISIFNLIIAILITIFFTVNGFIQYFFGQGVKADHTVPGLAIDSSTTPINFMDINKK